MTQSFDAIEMLDLAKRSLTDTRDPSLRTQALWIAALHLPTLRKTAWKVVEGEGSQPPGTRTEDQDRCLALDIRVPAFIASAERLETLLPSVSTDQGRARFDELCEKLVADFDSLYAEMTAIIARHV